MKTFKQLLWFIIPTIIISILLILNIMQSTNYPQFIKPQHYLRLLINDPLFLKALLNTLAKPIAVALVGGLIIYLIKSLLFRKINSKLKLPIYYACTFIISSVLVCSTAIMSALKGDPQQAYSVRTIMQHASDYQVWRLMNVFIKFPSILVMMQISVLVCFVFWLVEKVVSKFAGKSKTNDISIASETSDQGKVQEQPVHEA